MINKVRISIKSLFVLVMCLMAIQVVKVSLIALGGWASGLDGDISINKLSIDVVTTDWTKWHVYSVYLFPWIILLALAFIIGRKVDYPVKPAENYRMAKSWLFLLLIIDVLLISAIGIFSKTGIYYAFSWLGLSRPEQILFALILLILFFDRSARLGPFFATLIKIKGFEVKNTREVNNQLVNFLILPGVVLIFIIGILYNFNLDTIAIGFLTGFLFVMGLTYYQVMGYDVIVK